MTESTTHVYSIYINAPAQQVWDAITTSDYTTKWGYGGEVDVDLTPGGGYTNFTTDEMKQMGLGEVSVSGTVIEVTSRSAARSSRLLHPPGSSSTGRPAGIRIGSRPASRGS